MGRNGGDLRVDCSFSHVDVQGVEICHRNGGSGSSGEGAVALDVEDSFGASRSDSHAERKAVVGNTSQCACSGDQVIPAKERSKG